MALIAGFLAGIISGMGVGGGMILIPMLTIFTEVSQQQAQGINLWYFLPTAAAALVIHLKKRDVEYKKTMYIILSGIPCSILGAYAAIKLQSVLLRRLFGIFLGIFGIIEIYGGLQMKKNDV